MDDKLLSRALRRLRRFFRLIFSFLDRVFKLSTPPPSSSSSQPRRRYHRTSKPLPARPTTLDGFAHDVELQLVGHLTTDKLTDISRQIRAQLRTSAKNSPVSMLPSFNHTLPTGRERGTVLALDVGGSTLRVALVELSGSDAPIRIVRMTSYHIDEDVKLLEGRAFFDWMAQRIGEMLVGAGHDEKRDFGTSNVLPVGLSWSFPIDQTSIRSGRVISMGKGFLCSNGTVGEDLADLITEACQKRNLNVRIDAIINDSSATLLSRAYTDPTTRMSLILGTGTNVAVHFPVHAIGIEKFGDRPTDWFAQAKHVIVNTELSMFGGRGVLPRSRWDDELNRKHIKPDYQPLEYMATGRYLGEIVRLIIVEAVETAGLFGGELPPSMKHPYSFDTAISACIEEDDSPLLQTSSTVLQRHHSFTTPPTPIDLLFLQRVCKAVSRRAAAYLAAAIHGLWCLSNESESPLIPSTPKSNTIPEAGGTDGRASLRSSSNTQSPPLQVAIACDGSVINKYPNFREQCQGYLNQLTLEDGAFSPLLPVDFEDASFQSKEALASVRPSTLISLDPAQDSGILGAAVAVAIAVAPEG